MPARAALIDSARWFGLDRRRLLLAAGSFVAACLAYLALPIPKPDTDAVREELFFVGLTGVIGPTILFVSVFLVHLLHYTPRRLAEISRAAELEALLKDDDTDAIIAWLSSILPTSRYRLKRAYVFGSLLHNRPVEDIDILIQFRPASVRERRTSWRHLSQDIEPALERMYGKPTHWQRFRHDEDEAVDAFLAKAGEWKRIFEQ